MTRSEAIAKIAELQAFIASLPQNIHPPYARGQVYRHIGGALYLLIANRNVVNGQHEAVCISGGAFIGAYYSHLPLFAQDAADFTYFGLSKNVLSWSD